MRNTSSLQQTLHGRAAAIGESMQLPALRVNTWVSFRLAATLPKVVQKGIDLNTELQRI